MKGTGYKKKSYYRHISRYGEIISVLVKYGFGDLLSRINLEKYLSFGNKVLKIRRKKKIEEISRWDRIRFAIEELGPAFIKLGQFASNRPDILPAGLIESLERLQDSVVPFSGDEAVGIIEKEFGLPVEKMFHRFCKEPFASASIAQVHRAELMNGKEVAVKVQRPRIESIIAIDLEIMYHLASLIEKHIHAAEIYNLTQLVEEFAGAVQKELDFTIEALHIEHFINNFSDDKTVFIPEVYHNYSSRKVITTDFVIGIKVSNVKGLLEAGLNPKLVASRGADIILKQIFFFGFFHADPHPGNILVKEDNIICFLDLGMTGIITPTSREKLSLIILGIVEKNPRKIVKVLYTMSDIQKENREDLEYEIAELIQEYSSRSLRNINIGDVLHRLSRILSVHQLRVIPGFYLLVKALVTIEGIGYRLDPQFDFMAHLKPFASRLIREQLSPIHLANLGYGSLIDLFYFARDFPSEAMDVFQLAKSGKMKFVFEHQGLEPVMRRFDKFVNRIVFGLVLASLIIGSSIVVLSDMPPRLYGLPVIGIAGFIAAAIMGFWLLISILHHEKM